jgi:patatin-like phospholipase/acyl hydrolase
MRRICSVDGGGVRGCIAACFLVELEKQIGKPCREIFAMVAGTSTGAIIASSLCAGLSAAQILEFYQTDAPQIFNMGATEAWAWRIAQGYAYKSAKIAAVLMGRFGYMANWALNDCPIRILLCATKANGHELYFVQDNPKNLQAYGKLSLVECATASAAAPTYLDYEYVSPLGGKLVGWACDGGVSCSSNPVYDACVEAFYYDDFDPANTQVLSFGTGWFPSTAVNAPDGFIPTLSMTLDSLLYNSGKKQADNVNRHWPGIMQRFNAELPSAIDMADAAAIPQLVALGQKAAALLDWKKVLQV